MRMIKMMAGLIACAMMSSMLVTTAYAYTGEAAALEPVVTVEETTEKAMEKATEKTTEEATEMPSDWGTGTVKVDSSSWLHLRAGSGTDQKIIGHLLTGEKVTIISEEDGWYKVSVPEQSGYVCGTYLDVKKNPDRVQPDDANPPKPEKEAETVSDKGLTPDGNMTMVDDIGGSTSEGQQFITLVTKNGNTFYMVIDRDDDGNENVHFMNLVDEADLFALLDEDAQTAYTESQKPSEPEKPAGTEPAEPAEPEKQPEPQKKSNNWAPLMLLVLAAIGGVGGFLFVSVNKKKKEQEAAKPDPDADYKDEEDEEYEIPEEIEDEEDEDEYEAELPDEEE